MSKYEKLLAVQTELKAPKGQYNSFGKYKYRSCEDILEALKPVVAKVKATVFITDEIAQIGDRYYIKAAVHFVDVESGEEIVTTAFAREEENKKGMDGSQVTGASSSYARKYALNGMFDIDDTKDSDATNTGDAPKAQNHNIVDYRAEYLNICQKKKIDSIKYAKEHGINKETTQEQYKQICDTLNKIVSLNEI